jgi:hypothetical protein
MFLRPPVLWTKNQGQLVQVMPGFTEWLESHCPPSRILQRRFVRASEFCISTQRWMFIPDPIRSHFIACIFAYRYSHRLGKVLQFRFRYFWRPWWEARSGRPHHMVEQVIDDSFHSAHSHISRQIFPSFSTARRPLVKNSALARIREKRARTKESSVLGGDGGSV